MFIEDKEKFILPLVVKKADPYTLEHLVQWLETHDPAEKYPYWNCSGLCLISLYTAAVGDTGELSYSRTRRLFRTCDVQDDIAAPYPHTFGDALLRARSFLQAEGGK